MPPRPSAAEPARRPRRAVHPRLQRGAFLLPSLFTIGNMLLGFYAVIRGVVHQDYDGAALAIFAAAILDAMDGRIARMTGTESEFGKEYDSLADVVTFGAAPALLTYFWGLRDLHPDAWLVSLFFMVCAATRLARFNVQHKVVDSRYFVGLPVPAACGSICSILFFQPDPEWRQWMQVLVAVALLLIGILMVSTFRYQSGKKLDLRRPLSYRIAVPLAAVMLVVYYMPRAIFLTLALGYTLSAPLGWLWGQLRHGGSSPDPDSTLPPSPPPHSPQTTDLP